MCVLEAQMGVQSVWYEKVEIRDVFIGYCQKFLLGKKCKDYGDRGRGLAGRMLLSSPI